MARLIVSLLTLFSAFLFIVQSTDIIALMKGFTALYIIAELDDYAYGMIADGYFGSLFKKEVKSVTDIKLKKITVRLSYAINLSLVSLYLFW